MESIKPVRVMEFPIKIKSPVVKFSATIKEFYRLNYLIKEIGRRAQLQTMERLKIEQTSICQTKTRTVTLAITLELSHHDVVKTITTCKTI